MDCLADGQGGWPGRTAKADGQGSFEIMRRAETSKPMLWHWQQRYLGKGVAGLRRGNTRPSRAPLLTREIGLKVMGKTVQASPSNAVH